MMHFGLLTVELIKALSPEIFPLLQKFLPVAQAFQPVWTAWRAGTPAPPTFSCP
jgi:hypothetical protein